VRFEAPRGTHDILPDEWPRWERVAHEVTDVCTAYGYGRITTPGFEDTELFERTSGRGSDVVRKEMYTFTDRGGRSLTLRPEATAPIARAYVEHGVQRSPQPFKAYTLDTMYRYDRPQKGRYREHWQLSVEAIGSDDPAVDAELIQLYTELLRRLGVRRYRLDLNSIGDGACRPAYVERLTAWLDEHAGELSAEALEKRESTPLRVFDVKNESDQAVLAGAPTIADALCDDCREHFLAVRGYLDAYGVEYRLVPTLVRGLDYYTRTTFEFVGAAQGAQDAIAGGGRYDGLVEQIGGPPTPGIGFGAGIERLLLQQQEEGVEAAARDGIDVFFAIASEAPRERLLALMADLRRTGLACDTDYADRSLRGKLTQAKRLGARTTVIADNGGVTVRRTDTEDVVLPVDGSLDELREELLR
jgi:histidyl-tRNA synthetase